MYDVCMYYVIYVLFSVASIIEWIHVNNILYILNLEKIDPRKDFARMEKKTGYKTQ